MNVSKLALALALGAILCSGSISVFAGAEIGNGSSVVSSTPCPEGDKVGTGQPVADTGVAMSSGGHALRSFDVLTYIRR